MINFVETTEKSCKKQNVDTFSDYPREMLI